MKRKLIVLIAMVTVISGGVLWMRAAAPATSPVIGLVAVTPTVIPVGTPTKVSVTAQITDPSVFANGVNLLRLNSNGTTTILGVMHDDGANGDAVANDKIFTLNVAFQEATAGQIRLQVSAAFKGQLRRILSPITTIDAIVQSKITWSTDVIDITVAIGQSHARLPTFTSTIALQSVGVEAVSEIAPFLSVQPTTFATVFAGQPQSVDLTFNVPEGTTPKSYDGAIQVRAANQTLTETLRVTLRVVSEVSAEHTLDRIADELDAGDINSALQSFSASPLNRDVLSRLPAGARTRFAAGLRNARLTASQGSSRTYEVAGIVDGIPPRKMTLAKTDTGAWVVISW